LRADARIDEFAADGRAPPRDCFFLLAVLGADAATLALSTDIEARLLARVEVDIFTSFGTVREFLGTREIPTSPAVAASARRLSVPAL